LDSGRLIVFEGPDAVGKTTLSRLLAENLSDRGQDVLWTSFPGRQPGSLGELVYRLHHTPRDFGIGHIAEAARQTLHIAAHLDTISTGVLPALHRGAWVVLDRFWWSTLVYGQVGGADEEVLRGLIGVETLAWGEVRPSTLFLISREEPLVPQNDLSRWQDLASRYEDLGRSLGATMIDNNASLSDTLQSVLSKLVGLDDNDRSSGVSLPLCDAEGRAKTF
jgi:dTMP kinase